MMKQILLSVQKNIAESNDGVFVDFDRGQLDYYSPNFPVKFPVCLLEISNIEFSNIGKNKDVTPVNRQIATYDIIITVADLKLTNTSAKAPISQKQNALGIYDLIADIHKQIQGFSPDNSSKLIRLKQNRVKRDDGIQEYKIIYTSRAFNL